MHICRSYIHLLDHELCCWLGCWRVPSNAVVLFLLLSRTYHGVENRFQRFRFLFAPTLSLLETCFPWTQTGPRTISQTTSILLKDVFVVSPASLHLQSQEWRNIITSKPLSALSWSNRNAINPSCNMFTIFPFPSPLSSYGTLHSPGMY